jgi:uncharacterized protein YlzI (FlbEa/FlbD family)
MLIKFNLSDERRSVYVNPEHITSVTREADSPVTLSLINGNIEQVEGSLQDILKLLGPIK